MRYASIGFSCLHWRSRLNPHLIRIIPLSKRKVDDKLVWHYDKRGLFTVKKKCVSCHTLVDYPSLPHIAFLRKKQPLLYFVGETLVCFDSSKGKNDGMEDSLQYYTNWCEPYPKVDPYWSIVHHVWAEPKSTHHIMLDCHFARSVWMASPLGLYPGSLHNCQIKGRALQMALNMKQTDFDCVMMMLWAI